MSEVVREERERGENRSQGEVAGMEKENEVDSFSKSLLESQAGMFIDSPVWLSTKDAAIYLRKFRKIDGKPSVGAVRNAIWRGDLKARKWKRRVYIKKDDLDRLLRSSPFMDGGSAWV